MRYFNGFSLRDESHFFHDHLKEGDYNVAGFSHGAIKAVEYAYGSSDRIDTLQLFSPAFFQSKPERFRRMQMMGYQKNSNSYLLSFIESCFAPYDLQKVDLVPTVSKELEVLLYYVWDLDMLQSLTDRGIRIEVYLGSEDKIIDVSAAKELFLPYATTYMIKKANHFLQHKDNNE